MSIRFIGFINIVSFLVLFFLNIEISFASDQSFRNSSSKDTISYSKDTNYFRGKDDAIVYKAFSLEGIKDGVQLDCDVQERHFYVDHIYDGIRYIDKNSDDGTVCATTTIYGSSYEDKSVMDGIDYVSKNPENSYSYKFIGSSSINVRGVVEYLFADMNIINDEYRSEVEVYDSSKEYDQIIGTRDDQLKVVDSGNITVADNDYVNCIKIDVETRYSINEEIKVIKQMRWQCPVVGLVKLEVVSDDSNYTLELQKSFFNKYPVEYSSNDIEKKIFINHHENINDEVESIVIEYNGSSEIINKYIGTSLIESAKQITSSDDVGYYIEGLIQSDPGEDKKEYHFKPSVFSYPKVLNRDSSWESTSDIYESKNDNFSWSEDDIIGIRYDRGTVQETGPLYSYYRNSFDECQKVLYETGYDYFDKDEVITQSHYAWFCDNAGIVKIEIIEGGGESENKPWTLDAPYFEYSTAMDYDGDGKTDNEDEFPTEEFNRDWSRYPTGGAVESGALSIWHLFAFVSLISGVNYYRRKSAH